MPWVSRQASELEGSKRSGANYAAGVLARGFHLHALAALLLVSSCKRPESEQERAAKARASAAARLTKPRAIPPEPPFGELKVEDSGFSCEVDATLQAKCRRCHMQPARHGAPFPLMTWEQTQAVFRSGPIWRQLGAVVKSGFMPYRIPANPPVEPLTDAEKQALLAWVEAGGKRAECEAK